MSDYASESGHWYERDGTPRYTIVGRNGAERATTLRDARKMNLVPSVTTITGCAAAPGLEQWKYRQVLMSALTLQRAEGEPDDLFVKRILEDSREHARTAAARGTDIHGAIERHLLGESVDRELLPYAEAAMDQVERCFGRQEWAPEKSFASPLGYGGKVDLHSSEPGRVLVDFKSKDGALDDAKVKLYDTHHMQLAAYARGLWGEMESRQLVCAIVFVRRDAPEARLVMAPDADINSGWEQFFCLLRYWQAKTGHR